MCAPPTALRASAAVAFLLAAAALPGQEPDPEGQKPSLVIIRLPAGAALEIDGFKSKQEGEVRVFDTPPLTPGKVYVYLLRATWTDGDREVTREAKAVVRAGETTEVDMRRQRELPVSFKLVPPAALELRPGETKPLTVKVERDNFRGPVSLTFAGVPDGVKLPDMTIPAEQGETSIDVRADAGAPPGTHSVSLVARGGPGEQKASFPLTVLAPPSQAVEPPTTVPAPRTAALRLKAPAEVELSPGGKKAVTVEVTREGFKGPVKVTFEGLPGAGPRPTAMVPADRGSGEVEVTVPGDTPAGPVEVKVRGRADTAVAETAFRLVVRPPGAPKGSLAISLPESVTLAPGGPRRLLPVTVTRDRLQGPVRLHFESVPSGIVLSDAVVGEGKTRGYVAAEAGADVPEKEIEVKLVATCEEARAEAVLKVKVGR